MVLQVMAQMVAQHAKTFMVLDVKFVTTLNAHYAWAASSGTVQNVVIPQQNV